MPEATTAETTGIEEVTGVSPAGMWAIEMVSDSIVSVTGVRGGLADAAKADDVGLGVMAPAAAAGDMPDLRKSPPTGTEMAAARAVLGSPAVAKAEGTGFAPRATARAPRAGPNFPTPGRASF